MNLLKQKLLLLIFIGFLLTGLNLVGGSEIVGASDQAPAEKPAWTVVRDLKVGDWLKTKDGWQQIESIEYVREPITVYNLTVGYPNTFFANGILAHNKGPKPIHARVWDVTNSQLLRFPGNNCDCSGSLNCADGDGMRVAFDGNNPASYRCGAWGVHDGDNSLQSDSQAPLALSQSYSVGTDVTVRLTPPSGYRCVSYDKRRGVECEPGYSCTVDVAGTTGSCLGGSNFEMNLSGGCKYYAPNDEHRCVCWTGVKGGGCSQTVTASDGKGNLDQGIVFRVEKIPAEPTAPPENPCPTTPNINNPTSGDEAGDSITVSWGDVDNNSRYIVQRRIDGGSIKTIASNLGRDRTSYVDSSSEARNCGTYEYRVAAYTDDSSCCTNGRCWSEWRPIDQVINRPNCTNQFYASGRPRIIWNDRSEIEQIQMIQRRTYSNGRWGSYRSVGGAGSNLTSWTGNSACDGSITGEQFRVNAENDNLNCQSTYDVCMPVLNCPGCQRRRRRRKHPPRSQPCRQGRRPPQYRPVVPNVPT